LEKGFKKKGGGGTQGGKAGAKKVKKRIMHVKFERE